MLRITTGSNYITTGLMEKADIPEQKNRWMCLRTLLTSIHWMRGTATVEHSSFNWLGGKYHPPTNIQAAKLHIWSIQESIAT